MRCSDVHMLLGKLGGAWLVVWGQRRSWLVGSLLALTATGSALRLLPVRAQALMFVPTHRLAAAATPHVPIFQRFHPSGHALLDVR